MAPSIALFITIVCSFLFSSSSSSSSADPATLHRLIDCLNTAQVHNFTTDLLPNISTISYHDALAFSLQNLRYAQHRVPKPTALVFPHNDHQVQQAFLCLVKTGWELRVRSGGHSYEAISSWSTDGPFVILDLVAMNAVHVDVKSKTAWVQPAATLGEIYSGISRKTPGYGFPGGICPTVGSGGHFSGGGYGPLSRKYGVSADNVVDARLVDAAGNLLNRSSMGEDLFWALRGGGGGNWGIIVAWKIKLVQIPQTITKFAKPKVGLREVLPLLHKWQTVGASAPGELFLAVILREIPMVNMTTQTTALFFGQYLGPAEQALKLFNHSFPELGVNTSDLTEMSWIEGVAWDATLKGWDFVPSLQALVDRPNHDKVAFKAKSDYVTTPIQVKGLYGLLTFLRRNLNGFLILEPYGGIMSNISRNAIAFPHRRGNLYNIQYLVTWNPQATARGDERHHITWIRNFYSYMKPFVSKSPRAAYVNYMDLDLGTAALTDATTVAEASKWAKKYFLQNYKRLLEIKTRVDPYNVFRHPQSIPPLRNHLV